MRIQIGKVFLSICFLATWLGGDTASASNFDLVCKCYWSGGELAGSPPDQMIAVGCPDSEWMPVCGQFNSTAGPYTMGNVTCTTFEGGSFEGLAPLDVPGGALLGCQVCEVHGLTVDCHDGSGNWIEDGHCENNWEPTAPEGFDCTGLPTAGSCMIGPDPALQEILGPLCHWVEN